MNCGWHGFFFTSSSGSGRDWGIVAGHSWGSFLVPGLWWFGGSGIMAGEGCRGSFFQLPLLGC